MPKSNPKKSSKKPTAANVRSGAKLRKVRIASLFAGAGGLEIAACNTGKVEAIVSTDSHATFLSTTEKNMETHFPAVRHASIVADAKVLDGARLRSLLEATPHLVMGGPPCDDYTRFGRRRGIEGEKGPLIFEFLRIVEELQPECFVFENVPNLAQQFKGVFEKFLAQVQAINYHAKWALLKACDYGAPTQRKRVFVVGWRENHRNESFGFPEPTHADLTADDLFTSVEVGFKPFVYVRDVLSGLPDVKTPEAENCLNHTGRNHRPATIEHLKTVPIGKKIKKSFRYRAPWDGLTQSLTAGVDHSTKSYIHPHFHREMSVREYARIHSFPDSWYFCGTHHNGIKQVANAVPIPLGEEVLSSVINCLLNRERAKSCE
jgi:DNA (cytosine-5)-methyltransferase 1